MPATYRSIAASEKDHKSPITETLIEALAENPTAIAEGASGAPRIEKAALSVTTSSASVVLSGSAATFYVALGDYAFPPAVGVVPAGVSVGYGSSTTEDPANPNLRIVDTGGSSATISIQWRHFS